MKRRFRGRADGKAMRSHYTRDGAQLVVVACGIGMFWPSIRLRGMPRSLKSVVSRRVPVAVSTMVRNDASGGSAMREAALRRTIAKEGRVSAEFGLILKDGTVTTISEFE